MFRAVLILCFLLAGLANSIAQSDTTILTPTMFNDTEFDGVYFDIAKSTKYATIQSVQGFLARRIPSYGVGPADRPSYKCRIAFRGGYKVTPMDSIERIVIKGIKYTDQAVANAVIYKAPFKREKNCSDRCYYWCSPISPVTDKWNEIFYTLSLNDDNKAQFRMRKVAENHFEMILLGQASKDGYALVVNNEIFIFTVKQL